MSRNIQESLSFRESVDRMIDRAALTISLNPDTVRAGLQRGFADQVPGDAERPARSHMRLMGDSQRAQHAGQGRPALLAAGLSGTGR